MKLLDYIIIFFIGAVVVVLIGHFFERIWAMADGRSWALSADKSEVVIGNKKWQVEVVEDDWLRAKGLSGREKLKNRHGMLFKFDRLARHTMWMKGMEFPIDIIWIKRGVVVDITYNAEPLTLVPPPSRAQDALYRPSQPADMALEINAGEATGIRTGDRVVISGTRI